MQQLRAYRDLNFWEKLAVWGSLASILGLLGTAAVFLPESSRKANELAQDKNSDPEPTETVVNERENSPQDEVVGVISESATAGHLGEADNTSSRVEFGQIRRIVGIAYSYSEAEWAREGLGSNKLPQISLAFWSGLVAGPTLRWEGSYRVTSKELCLTIEDVRMPRDLPILSSYYTDFALGYGVELTDATFADYTMARSILLYRTFTGDQPPPKIEKCFDLRRPETLEASSSRLNGRWKGKYTESHATGRNTDTSFVALLQQTGNRIEGTIVDSLDPAPGASSPRRVKASADGLVMGDRLSIIKRYEAWPIGVSYVATIKQDSEHQVEGTWYTGVERGKWQMSRVGELKGSPEEVISADSTNPPLEISDSGVSPDS